MAMSDRVRRCRFQHLHLPFRKKTFEREMSNKLARLTYVLIKIVYSRSILYPLNP